MFDFLFGGKKKLNLIRELIERRMADSGYDEIQYQLKIKELTNLQLMSTPEGTLVTIMETIFKLQNKGLLLNQAIARVEDHRSKLGVNSRRYLAIIELTRDIDKAGIAVFRYCEYRLEIENPGVLNQAQLKSTFDNANAALTFIV